MALFRWTKPAKQPQKPDELPYGLNPDKLAALDELQQDKRYAILVKLLQDIAEDRGLNLLHYKETGDFRFWQGYINALRDVCRLIPDLVERYVRQQQHAAESGPREGNGEPDRRSFYGSPYWDDLSPHR